jgi:hypothetical protein
VEEVSCATEENQNYSKNKTVGIFSNNIE